MAAPPRAQLMSLPPEVRTIIYEMVFDGNKAKVLCVDEEAAATAEATHSLGALRSTRPRCPPPDVKYELRYKAPALSLCSKPIYSEAASVYYRRTFFEFSSGCASAWAPAWLMSLPNARHSLVAKVGVSIGGDLSYLNSPEEWTQVAKGYQDQISVLHTRLAERGVDLATGVLRVRIFWEYYRDEYDEDEYSFEDCFEDEETYTDSAWTSDPVQKVRAVAQCWGLDISS